MTSIVSSAISFFPFFLSPPFFVYFYPRVQSMHIRLLPAGVLFGLASSITWECRCRCKVQVRKVQVRKVQVQVHPGPGPCLCFLLSFLCWDR